MADHDGNIDQQGEAFFRVTDTVPEETWYWLAVVSIGISAVLRLTGKHQMSTFVGQWPPTFLLFGIYHRLVRNTR